jgi:hypothetical protein
VYNEWRAKGNVVSAIGSPIGEMKGVSWRVIRMGKKEYDHEGFREREYDRFGRPPSTGYS